MSLLRQLWTPLALAVSALSLATAFRGPVVAVLLVVAVFATWAVCVLGARTGRGPAGAALGWCLAVLVAGLTMAGTGPATQPPGGGAAAGVAGRLLDAVPRLLGSTRPVPVRPELFALPLVLTVLVSAAVLLSRRRGRWLPAGCAVLYTAGALLTVGAGDRHGLVAAGLLAVVVGSWLADPDTAIQHRTADPGALDLAVRRPGVALGVVGVAVALLAGVVPAPDPFDPSTLMRGPAPRVHVSSPLPMLAVWAREPDRVLFSVAGTVPDRVHLAVLSDHDGVAWRIRSPFEPIGAAAEPELPAGPRQARTDLTVTLSGLSGPFLPAAGVPADASRAGLLVDGSSGTLLDGDAAGSAGSSGPAAASTTPTTYRVTALLDQPTDAQVAAGGLAPTTDAERYLSVGRLPTVFVDYATAGSQAARTPYARALAIRELVRSGRTWDPQAPAGSSFVRLQSFLFGQAGTAGALRGTAEQFATSYVLLARAVGLPSRLVLGFDVPRPSPRPGADAAARPVRAGNATVWAQVYLTGAGWVTIDPMPSRAVVQPPADGAKGPRSAALQRSDREPLSLPVVTPRASAVRRAGLALAMVLGGGAALLGVGWPAWRIGRRRRRRRANVRSGAVGAWQEVVDALAVLGRCPDPAEPAETTAVVAARLAGRPDDEVLVLAEVAQRAAFGPEPAAPGRHDRAWDQATVVVRDLRRGAPRRLRWQWWLRTTRPPGPRRPRPARIRRAVPRRSRPTRPAGSGRR